MRRISARCVIVTFFIGKHRNAFARLSRNAHMHTVCTCMHCLSACMVTPWGSERGSVMESAVCWTLEDIHELSTEDVALNMAALLAHNELDELSDDCLNLLWALIHEHEARRYQVA